MTLLIRIPTVMIPAPMLSNAHPGQTSYFTTSRGDGSFDYDCSGSETKNADCTSVGTCTITGSCGLGCGEGTAIVSSDCTTVACGQPVYECNLVAYMGGCAEGIGRKNYCGTTDVCVSPTWNGAKSIVRQLGYNSCGCN